MILNPQKSEIDWSILKVKLPSPGEIGLSRWYLSLETNITRWNWSLQVILVSRDQYHLHQVKLPSPSTNIYFSMFLTEIQWISFLFNNMYCFFCLISIKCTHYEGNFLTFNWKSLKYIISVLLNLNHVFAFFLGSISASSSWPMSRLYNIYK